MARSAVPASGQDPQAPSPPNLGNLTSLRFFAAMWVVLLHFSLGYLKSAPGPLREFVGHGQSGVTLFFVLSGFILGYVYLPVLQEKRISHTRFWQARFARVYPLYALSLLIALPLLLISGIQGGLLAKVTLLQVPLLQSWDPPLLYAGQWNTPSWSLSTEAFFYLFFPWFCLWIASVSRHAVIRWAIGMLLIAVLTRTAYLVIDPDHLAGAIPDVTRDFWSGVLFYNPIVRSLEFVFGLCLVRLTLRAEPIEGARRKGPNGWQLLVLVAGGIAIFCFPNTPAAAIATYPLSVLFFGLLIVGLATCRAATFNRWFASPSMLLLGEASYGVYMLQRPLADWLDYSARPLRHGPVEYDGKLFILFLVVLIGGSVLALKFFELPMRRILRSLGKGGAV